jgi:hypothetical protein
MWSELRGEHGIQIGWVELPFIYDMDGRKYAKVDENGQICTLDGSTTGIYLGLADDGRVSSAAVVRLKALAEGH